MEPSLLPSGLYGSIPTEILKQYREEKAIIIKRNPDLLSDFHFNFEKTVFSKYDNILKKS